MRILPRLFCLGAVLLLLGVADPGAGAEPWTERWKSDIAEIDQLLVSEQWKKAQRRIRDLRDEMYLSVVGGGQGWLAMVAALSAVAYAGDGDTHQARWMWDVANQLFPDAEILDLERFGDLTDPLLAEYPEPGESRQEDHASDATLTPPKKRRTPKPRFPPARMNRGQHVAIVVQFVVGVDGFPYNPTLYQSAGEYTMVLSALETIGKWRFTPARLGTRPVAVVYNLTVNFKVP